MRQLRRLVRTITFLALSLGALALDPRINEFVAENQDGISDAGT